MIFPYPGPLPRHEGTHIHITTTLVLVKRICFEQRAPVLSVKIACCEVDGKGDFPYCTIFPTSGETDEGRPCHRPSQECTFRLCFGGSLLVLPPVLFADFGQARVDGHGHGAEEAELRT